MVNMARSLFVAALCLCVSSRAVMASSIDIAVWAKNLPERFLVHGVKIEPTYEEAVDIGRNGDVFTLVGGAPGWAERSEQRIVVAADGAFTYSVCPKHMNCDGASPPTGFLATAALLSSSRRDQLHGIDATMAFGRRQVVCLPAELIGVSRPLFDPCFDVESGAVLAQRLRSTGQLDGPTLDPEELAIAIFH